MTEDVPYWIERSHVEAVRSIQARHPAAAAAHAWMCVLYTRQAAAALAGLRASATLP